MAGLVDIAATLNNIAKELGLLITQKAQTPLIVVTSVPIYTFAGLPSAAGSPGLVVFCSNGLEPGQLTGAGTGMLAFSNGSSWRSTAGGALAS